MEQVRKDHYSTFCKHLPTCDPSLGADVLRELHVHYDLNSKSKMLTKSSRCLCTLASLLNKSCHSLGCGMSMLF
jgi:hypothetical protein